MKATGYLMIMALTLAPASLRAESTERARQLVEAMVDKVGAMKELHRRRDVEYTYVYRRPTGQTDVSVERYVFDGELSWGRYVVHDVLDPEASGEIIQGYVDGQAWVTVDGKPNQDAAAVARAAFVRPTNYYWFAMMPKLLDPGVKLEHLGGQTVDGVAYDRVNVTFSNSKKEKTDRYLLYINPKTKLVDRFLFTVIDYGMTDPLLMTVEYEEIDGLLLPTRRRYAPAKDWNGEVEKEAWVEETMLTIRFNNGFPRAAFAAPE